MRVNKSGEMGKRRLQAGESRPAPAYAGAAIDWLTKKRLPVPAALAQAYQRGLLPDAALADEMQWVLLLLPALKERERRSLARAATRIQPAPAQGGPSGHKAEPSGGDEGTSESEAEVSAPEDSAARPAHWPPGVAYTNAYVWHEAVPPEVLRKYTGLGGAARAEASRSSAGEGGYHHPAGGGRCTRAPKRRRRGPCPRVEVRRIDDARHPAFGQCGLFAVAPLPRGTRAVDYVGRVSLGRLPRWWRRQTRTIAVVEYRSSGVVE